MSHGSGVAESVTELLSAMMRNSRYNLMKANAMSEALDATNWCMVRVTKPNPPFNTTITKFCWAERAQLQKLGQGLMQEHGVSGECGHFPFQMDHYFASACAVPFMDVDCKIAMPLQENVQECPMVHTFKAFGRRLVEAMKVTMQSVVTEAMPDRSGDVIMLHEAHWAVRQIGKSSVDSTEYKLSLHAHVGAEVDGTVYGLNGSDDMNEFVSASISCYVHAVLQDLAESQLTAAEATALLGPLDSVDRAVYEPQQGMYHLRTGLCYKKEQQADSLFQADSVLYPLHLPGQARFLLRGSEALPLSANFYYAEQAVLQAALGLLELQSDRPQEVAQAKHPEIGKLLKDPAIVAMLRKLEDRANFVEMQAQLKDPKVKQLPVPESSMAVKECYLSSTGMLLMAQSNPAIFQKLLDIVSLVALSVFELHNKDGTGIKFSLQGRPVDRQVAMSSLVKCQPGWSPEQFLKGLSGAFKGTGQTITWMSIKESLQSGKFHRTGQALPENLVVTMQLPGHCHCPSKKHSDSDMTKMTLVIPIQPLRAEHADTSLPDTKLKVSFRCWALDRHAKGGGYDFKRNLCTSNGTIRMSVPLSNAKGGPNAELRFALLHQVNALLEMCDKACATGDALALAGPDSVVASDASSCLLAVSDEEVCRSEHLFETLSDTEEMCALIAKQHYVLPSKVRLPMSNQLVDVSGSKLVVVTKMEPPLQRNTHKLCERWRLTCQVMAGRQPRAEEMFARTEGCMADGRTAFPSNHQLATEYAAGYRDKSNVYRDGLLQQLVNGYAPVCSETNPMLVMYVQIGAVSYISAILPMYPSKNATLVDKHTQYSDLPSDAQYQSQTKPRQLWEKLSVFCFAQTEWQVLQFLYLWWRVSNTGRPVHDSNFVLPMNPLMNRFVTTALASQKQTADCTLTKHLEVPTLVSQPELGQPNQPLVLRNTSTCPDESWTATGSTAPSASNLPGAAAATHGTFGSAQSLFTMVPKYLNHLHRQMHTLLGDSQVAGHLVHHRLQVWPSRHLQREQLQATQPSQNSGVRLHVQFLCTQPGWGQVVGSDAGLYFLQLPVLRKRQGDGVAVLVECNEPAYREGMRGCKLACQQLAEHLGDQTLQAVFMQDIQQVDLFQFVVFASTMQRYGLFPTQDRGIQVHVCSTGDATVHPLHSKMPYTPLAYLRENLAHATVVRACADGTIQRLGRFSQPLNDEAQFVQWLQALAQATEDGEPGRVQQFSRLQVRFLKDKDKATAPVMATDGQPPTKRAKTSKTAKTTSKNSSKKQSGSEVSAEYLVYLATSSHQMDSLLRATQPNMTLREQYPRRCGILDAVHLVSTRDPSTGIRGNSTEQLLKTDQCVRFVIPLWQNNVPVNLLHLLVLSCLAHARHHVQIDLVQCTLRPSGALKYRNECTTHGECRRLFLD